MKHVAAALGLSVFLAGSVHARAPGFAPAMLLGGSDSGTTPELLDLDVLSGTPQTFTYDNSGASTGLEGQAQSLCSVGGNLGVPRDVWFKWQANFTGVLTLSTCPFTTVNTKIAAYAGQVAPLPTNGDVALACNDDYCFPGVGGSQINFACTQDAWYVFQIGSSAGLPVAPGGTGTVQMIRGGVPLNDDCGTAQLIAGPGPFGFNTTFATDTVGPPTGCGAPIYKDLWFTYKTTTAGTLTVSTCSQMTSTGRNTMIALYDQDCSTVLACNDDALVSCAPPGSPLESIVSISTSGPCFREIRIRVGGAVSGESLVGTFTVTEVGTSCNTPSIPFCVGRGNPALPGTFLCPCASTTTAPGHGCPTAAYPGGAILSSSGVAGLSSATDTLVLTATDITGPALFFQSTGLAPTPINFGDGLLCATAGITRLGVVFPAGGVASYPGGPSPQPIHVAGGLGTSIAVRHYQVWYRSIPAQCAGAFNLTQGLTLIWS